MASLPPETKWRLIYLDAEELVSFQEMGESFLIPAQRYENQPPKVRKISGFTHCESHFGGTGRSYSHLNATIGSIFVARRAGM
jgi:hypothetical protein